MNNGSNGGPSRATRRAIRYKRGSSKSKIVALPTAQFMALVDSYLPKVQQPLPVLASDLESKALYSPL